MRHTPDALCLSIKDCLFAANDHTDELCMRFDTQPQRVCCCAIENGTGHFIMLFLRCVYTLCCAWLLIPSCILLTQEDAEDDGAPEDGQPRAGHEQPTQKKGSLGPKLEADYDFFVNVMWAAITTKNERQTMTPAVVYQVLHLCYFHLT